MYFIANSKLKDLWNDKASVRNRNEFVLELMPTIKKIARWRCVGVTYEPCYANELDAFSDTIILALRSWHNFTEMENFLIHIFGYLKYYKVNRKCYEQRYPAYEYIFFERLVAQYALSIPKLKVPPLLKSLPTLEREILEMFVLDGWSKKEIAQKLDMTELMVDKCYRNALKLCRLNRCTGENKNALKKTRGLSIGA
jgi:DNA-directed RNA polymerase specialized sigma24 family protein